MNNKLTYGAIAITFIVAVLALFGNFGHTSQALGDAIINKASTNFMPSLGLIQLERGTGCDQSFSCNNAIRTVPSTGACLTGTSTLFAIQNPFAATSTVKLVHLEGTAGNATSTNVSVGTSTTGFAFTSTFTSNVSPTLLNAATIATTSPFYFASGVSVGGVGQVGTGGTTYASITVGPNDWVVGQSTTTAVLSASANFSTTNLYTGCVYGLEWTN